MSALLGRSAGATGATFGTTHHRCSHTYSVQGVEGTLLLTDTPGLGDSGPQGAARTAEAIDLACAADLVLFVVDHDLTRTERDTLIELARLDKRLIAVLNKKDRFTEEDRGAILGKICERLDGFVPPEDILAVAAAPAPVPVRARMPDGTTAIELEVEPPALVALEDRVAEILANEGDALRAGNLLLRERLREQARRTQIALERRERARILIERHQWIAAATAFANPVLALGPLAVGAVQLRMLSEIAALHEVPLSTQSLEMVGRQMAQTLFKLGIAEAAGSVLAGIFKFNPLGFAAGGIVQATTMAYLTRVIGDSFLEYLERGGVWGEGGMQGVLSRHFAASSASGWLVQFSKAVISHLLKR